MNTTAVTLSTGTLEDTDLDTTLENILATDTPGKSSSGTTPSTS